VEKRARLGLDKSIDRYGYRTHPDRTGQGTMAEKYLSSRTGITNVVHGQSDRSIQLIVGSWKEQAAGRMAGSRRSGRSLPHGSSQAELVI
jgi:hypothetical protein